MTGERVVYRYERRTDPARVTRYNPEGHVLHEAEYVQLDPAPFTRDQFYTRFPYALPAMSPEPDDGGLFERVRHCFDSVTVSS